jgi:hypothetical protein
MFSGFLDGGSGERLPGVERGTGLDAELPAGPVGETVETQDRLGRSAFDGQSGVAGEVGDEIRDPIMVGIRGGERVVSGDVPAGGPRRVGGEDRRKRTDGVEVEAAEFVIGGIGVVDRISERIERAVSNRKRTDDIDDADVGDAVDVERRVMLAELGEIEGCSGSAGCLACQIVEIGGVQGPVSPELVGSLGEGN